MDKMHDKDWQKKLCVLTVNYNTPDLVESLVGSVREFWPRLKIVIVDGSDDKEKAEAVAKFCARDPNIELHTLGYNIHHGPGIVYAMERLDEDYVFLIDTDDLVIRGDIFVRMLELMTPEVYGVGTMTMVNGACEPRVEGAKIPYVFPNGMLLNSSLFFDYPPPIIHDGPMITPMKAIREAGESEKRLRHFPGLDGIYLRRGAGATRIRNAVPEECHDDWLQHKKDMIRMGEGVLSQRHICNMGQEGAAVEYRLDMLEWLKDKPRRIARTLVIKECTPNTLEVRGQVTFPYFKLDQLASLFSTTLKLVAKDMTDREGQLVGGKSNGV